MESFSFNDKVVVILLLLLLSNSAFLVSSADVETYIVHVLPKADSTFTSALERIGWYESLLPNKSQMVYSYGKVMSGFAARLSADELAALKLVEGFVYAIPDRTLSLQTTHSPAFLGLSSGAPGLWKDSSFGQGVIIGVLDSGIKVGHPSFSDNGLLPPPPSKWKGSCEYNASDCNNKLIGAKTFLNGAVGLPPYDEEGHGTHTASTAAGMFVDGANVDGQANGTAAGIAPYAHLAIYRVCSLDNGCQLSDVLAGLDSAVEDGVDVVSISIGVSDGSSVPFYQDGMAIGTFGATEHGVFVSVSAGNDGPSPATLSNEAPWMLTVGASSVDRLIEGTLYLNNGPVLAGETLYQPSDFPLEYHPLIYPGGIAGTTNAAVCSSLTGIDVTGKVVLCDEGNIERVTKGINVKNAGGVAMIIANMEVQGYTTTTDAHVLPALHVSYADGVQVKLHLQSEDSPAAAIAFNGTFLGTKPAPIVASFSSRGPTRLVDLIKPDIIGPGLNILAAWPVQVGEPTSSSTFNVISGTSMAAPHLSGTAALLKSLHQDWSPAAIKSAIMTSADIVGNDGNPIQDETLSPASFYAIGSGHVNPSKAANPGLVYDIAPPSYIAYLCASGYADTEVSAIARKTIACSDYLSQYGGELNYPSFMAVLTAANNHAVVASRNVTNVGDATSSYTVQVASAKGMSMIVSPEQLSFTEANQVLQYTVTFSTQSSTASAYSGYVQWVSSDEAIIVRSPVIVVVL